MPVAVSCSWVPAAIVGLLGVIAIDTSVAFVTVNVVDPVRPWSKALIVAVPGATPVATPSLPAAFEIVATVVFVVVQVATVVMSAVEPSLNVPIAMNCSSVFLAIVGLTGWSAIAVSVAFVTVSVVVPFAPPKFAVIVVVPTFALVAMPSKPTWFEIVATAVLLEVQVAESVMSWTTPLLKVTVAVNCSSTPFAIDGFAGEMTIEEIVAAVTVTVEESLKPPTVQPMSAVPTSTAVARPWLPDAFDTVATAAFVVLHSAVVVRSCVELSLNTPVHVNWTVDPFAMVGLTGVTTTLVSVTPVTVSVVDPEMVPKVARIVVAPFPVADARPFEPAVFEIVATLATVELHVAWAVRSCVELSL